MAMTKQMEIEEVAFRLHVREAVSLLRLLDGTDQDLAHHAANYGVANGGWEAWVEARIQKQLERAGERNQAGPFEPVIVAASSAERLAAVWPTGSILWVRE